MKKKQPRNRPNQKIKARRSKSKPRVEKQLSEKAAALIQKFWYGV